MAASPSPSSAGALMRFDEEADETLPDLNITGINRPAYTGSYGTIFKQSRDRLQPNLFEVQRNIQHKAIRAAVRVPNEELDKKARHFGLMINKGTDSTDVVRYLIHSHELQQQKKEFGLEGVLALDGGSRSIANQYESQEVIERVEAANTSKNAKKKTGRRRKKEEIGDSGAKMTIARQRDTMAAEADMSLSTAVMSIDRLPGGRYYIAEERTTEPYQPRVLGQRSGEYNAFNPHTPKAWPDATKYTHSSNRRPEPQQQLAKTGSTLLTKSPPHSQSRPSPSLSESVAHPCSKSLLAQSRPPGGSSSAPVLGALDDDCSSFSVSSVSSNYTATKSIAPDTYTGAAALQSLSSLQQSMIRCGRLSLIDGERLSLADSYVAKASAQHMKYLNSLGQWLRVEDNEMKKQQQQEQEQQRVKKERTAHTRDKKISFKHLLGSARLADEGDRVQLRRQRYDKTYDESIAEHLQMLTSSSLANPYRRCMEVSDRPQMNRSRHTVPKDDPVQYRPAYSVKSVGRFSVLTRASTEAGGVPTRQAIDQALSSLCKKSTLCYDVRLVETGAAARALWDVRNPAPGVAAVIALHRTFVNAASLNPDPWLLTRQQAHSVIMGSVPWLGDDVTSRLLSSYDPQRSGLVRFVRLSVSLMCCARPAMTNLITLLNKGYKSRNKHKQQGAADYDSDDEERRLARLASDYEGELFLLRLIHGLYEECEGRVSVAAVCDDAGRQVTAAQSVGMRIEDVFESLSCCCLRVEDELAMERVVRPLLQLIYDEGQEGDEVTAINRKKKSLQDVLNECGDSSGWEGLAPLRDDESSIGGDRSLLLGGDSLAWTAARDGSSVAEGSATRSFRQFLLDKGSRAAGSGRKNTVYRRHTTGSTAENGACEALSATAVIRHRGLKAVKRIPRIQENDFIRFILHAEPVLREFLRQLRAYRDVTEPYGIKGSVHFDHSMQAGSSYGTRCGRVAFEM